MTRLEEVTRKIERLEKKLTGADPSAAAWCYLTELHKEQHMLLQQAEINKQQSELRSRVLALEGLNDDEKAAAMVALAFTHPSFWPVFFVGDLDAQARSLKALVHLKRGGNVNKLDRLTAFSSQGASLEENLESLDIAAKAKQQDIVGARVKKFVATQEKKDA